MEEKSKEEVLKEFIRIATEIAESGERLYFSEIMERALEKLEVDV